MYVSFQRFVHCINWPNINRNHFIGLCEPVYPVSKVTQNTRCHYLRIGVICAGDTSGPLGPLWLVCGQSMTTAREGVESKRQKEVKMNQRGANFLGGPSGRLNLNKKVGLVGHPASLFRHPPWRPLLCPAIISQQSRAMPTFDFFGNFVGKSFYNKSQM